MQKPDPEVLRRTILQSRRRAGPRHHGRRFRHRRAHRPRRAAPGHRRRLSAIAKCRSRRLQPDRLISSYTELPAAIRGIEAAVPKPRPDMRVLVENSWTVRGLSRQNRPLSERDGKRAATGTDEGTRGLIGGARPAGFGRPVRPRHHLFARLGDRPLRFPLRLLHGGEHVVSAEGRSPDARRTRPAVFGLRRPRRPQASPHRRRAAGPPRHHDAGRFSVAAPARGRPRRTDADHQRLAARQICRRSQGRTACAASMSRSTRSTPTNSAPSPAGAISIRCSPASTPRRPRA